MSEVLGIEPMPHTCQARAVAPNYQATPKPSLIHLATVPNPCYKGAKGSDRQTDWEEKYLIEAGE